MNRCGGDIALSRMRDPRTAGRAVPTVQGSMREFFRNSFPNLRSFAVRGLDWRSGLVDQAQNRIFFDWAVDAAVGAAIAIVAQHIILVRAELEFFDELVSRRPRGFGCQIRFGEFFIIYIKPVGLDLYTLVGKDDDAFDGQIIV